jgi:hypothetical protein
VILVTALMAAVDTFTKTMAGVDHGNANQNHSHSFCFDTASLSLVRSWRRLSLSDKQKAPAGHWSNRPGPGQINAGPAKSLLGRCLASVPALLSPMDTRNASSAQRLSHFR